MSDIVTLNGYKIKDEKAVRSYESIAQMKADTKLKEGYHVKTKGYYEANDGGHGEYVIVDDDTLVDDGGLIHVLSNGLRAKLIEKDIISPELFGAYGDDEHDDTLAIQTMFNKFKNIKLNENKTYKVTSTITLPNNVKIVGCGITSMIKSYIDDGSAIFTNIENVSHFIIKDFYLNANNKNAIGFYFTQPYDNCIIENIYFSGFYNSAIKIGSEDYISQTLLLNNNIVYVSTTNAIINPLFDLTRVYEANITNNKLLGHEPNPIAKACLELTCCYDCSVIGNSFAHTGDCGIRIKSTENHDCRLNRIISNTYENITGDYIICLEGETGKEITQTIIIESGKYYNAPNIVFCDKENQALIIGLEVTGGRRNLALNINSSLVQNAYGNGFITLDNKAISMSGIGLQGYDKRMRYRIAVNDSENNDYGISITDTRNQSYKKEITKSYEGNICPGYRIKLVSPDGNTTKYIGIDNNGDITAYDNYI